LRQENISYVQQRLMVQQVFQGPKPSNDEIDSNGDMNADLGNDYDEEDLMES
jgi:hypothetical protein